MARQSTRRQDLKRKGEKMLDLKLADELAIEITGAPGLGDVHFDTWVYDDIKAKISLVLTRTYQEGQRDAFLAMGSFMKHQK